jgi:MurNAc alpha-1-phosphate uridylyltransferase
MKAMILAAGRGERMRPLTDATPKPLLNVRGKPLIEWHIQRLADTGFTDIVINTAWLGEQLPEVLGDGSRWHVRLHYSHENSTADPHCRTGLETAGGIRYALSLLTDLSQPPELQPPFLVINGDVWMDFDPHLAVQAADIIQQQQCLAYLWLVQNPSHHPHGDFGLHDGVMLDLAYHLNTASWTFSGVGVYSPQLFSAIKLGDSARLAPILRAAMVQRQILGEIWSGEWVDVGTVARLNLLNTGYA